MEKSLLHPLIKQPLSARGLWRLLLFICSFLPLSAGAQGLPLIHNYTSAEYGGHNRNYDIEIGVDGTVYVANFEGLLYFDHARWRIIHTPEISRVTVVYRDSKNTIWVGGYNFFARLQQRDNGELYMQPMGEKGLFKGEVMEIFEDGAVQFVTSANSIYEVHGNSVSLKSHTNTSLYDGLDSNIISVEALTAGDEDVILDDITQTEELDGGLQVKVKRNVGLIVADGQGRELYTITEDNGLCSNQVAYVAYDGHGILWGATSHGIFSIELPSVYSYFLAKDGLTGEVHSITAFDGKMYVGGSGGLFTIASYQCKRVADINNICWKLCPSGDVLFAATSSGIYRIAAGGSISRPTSNATTAMLVDGDKVYAAEPDGIYCYEADFQQRTKVCDLSLVTDIRMDADGNLLFQTVYGETASLGDYKAPVGETASSTLTNSQWSGVSSHLYKPLSNIELRAQYRYGDQVWMGGDEMLAIIDTGKEDLAALTDNRTIRFCSITLGNDSVLWGGYGNMPKALQGLGSNERHLHFFYSLNYKPLSGKTLYRYKLSNKGILGTSGHWSAWTEKQDVEFLNLPYGSYTLSIQAQLANGELSEVASVDFSVAYPLLMRWYMVLIYLILFAYVVYLLFRYRLKRLQKDKVKLERIVEERTSEVVKQKDEIVRQKDEIEEKSKSLEKALDDLSNAQNELIRQEKMATVGKLTEGLIDRILNPMNYIINFSKMSNDLLKDLKENIDNNKEAMNEDDYEDTIDVLCMLTENLQHVDQYGQNTTRILKAMEEMLKDRSGDFVDMDLVPVLQQNEKMLSNYFAKEKAQYHIRITVTLPTPEAGGASDAGDVKPLAMPLYGNPELLSKTVMSLLGNAVYAVVKKAQKALLPSHSGGAGGGAGSYAPEVMLTATISPDGGTYVLKIHDNGVGIEEKILSKIFDPFFTTKTTGEAAGVGLYLSREIIQNHGGDITVHSVKDEYTEFTITLPAANGNKGTERMTK